MLHSVPKQSSSRDQMHEAVGNISESNQNRKVKSSHWRGTPVISALRIRNSKPSLATLDPYKNKAKHTNKAKQEVMYIRQGQSQPPRVAEREATRWLRIFRSGGNCCEPQDIVQELGWALRLAVQEKVLPCNQSGV